ncbi:U6 snRNA-associated Sm-like protein LSm4 [Paramacrobiotus metropolitanus]|uniref:U6 snRNA-associated Sm-like protein LSm4 n=1 Tax=Paramacrobiotus metropolitanus TaxID=2943436 RepID=UPI0024464516|nr:U6 snRNA-associated Sm-like protein LSm4 [Paramacrobiotus metropolitanus]
MLPLALLRGALNHAVLVELKNGETYNGQLINVDNWMNINLKDAICTSRDGERFWKMDECYVRGSSIKFLRVPDEVADIVKTEMSRMRNRPDNRRPGSGFSPRGRGGGPPRGRGGM